MTYQFTDSSVVGVSDVVRGDTLSRRFGWTKLLSLVIALLGGAGGIGLVVWGGGGAIAILEHVPIDQVAAILFIASISLIIRGFRWFLLCRMSGIAISAPKGVVNYFTGFAMAFTPGKIGEVYRLWHLRAQSGCTLAKGLPIAVADRLFDLLALILIAAFGVAGFPSFSIPIGLAVTAILAVTGVCVFAYRLLPLFLKKLPRRWTKARFVGAAACRFSRRLQILRSPSRFCLLLAVSLVSWVTEAAVLLAAVGAAGASIGIVPAMFSHAFSLFAGILSFLPGGLGGTEAAMIGLLTASGVETSSAIAATTLFRASTLWLSLAIGLACSVGAVLASRSLPETSPPLPKKKKTDD